MKTSWQKRTLKILQFPTLFAGAAALTNTAGSHADAATINQAEGGTNLGPPLLPNTLNSTASDKYAAHRSHSSHGSHRSGSSGRIRMPSPIPSPRITPPVRAIPTHPRANPAPPARLLQPAPPARLIQPAPQNVSFMIVRVQAALMRLGYYHGDIDGILGPTARAAIRKYQKAQSIPQTGRMDIKTLTKLGISIP